MKIAVILLLLVFMASGAHAATVEEMILQAKAKYAQGQTQEALGILGTAMASNPSAADTKRSLADAYVDLGTKEYERKNYKNAYECFRNALKLSPGNPVASQYFWKMKSELDVNALKNEGEASAAQTPPTAQGTTADGSTATAAPGPETAASREALERAKKAEQELEALKSAALAAREENSSLRKDLEAQQRAAAQEVDSVRRSAASAAAESASLRVELERRQKLTEQEQEAVRRDALAARGENSQLKSELGQQKLLIDQLGEAVRKADLSARQDTRGLSDMLNTYRQTLAEEKAARSMDSSRLADQLSQQKALLETQARAVTTRNLILLGSLIALIVLLLVFTLFILRARARRRLRLRPEYATARYPALMSAAAGAQTTLAQLPDRESLLLEHFPALGKGEEGGQSQEETAMYQDLLRAERIKRMHDHLKRGTLRWDTVREYIQELDKDLRVEVLKLAEAKITEGDGIDPRAVLAVLLPYLTEYDDFLREKAELLVKRTLVAGRGGREAIGMLEETTTGEEEDGDSPLSMKRLMAVATELKNLLKDRDRSPLTAKIVRGMSRILGFSNEDTQLLYKTALVHDVGYLRLDQNRLKQLLAKPEITETEFRFIESHVKTGAEYFADEEVPEAFIQGITYHHERNDGSGYPKGLKSPKIPLFAKMIGVAETYVALTSERPYREKMSGESALAILKDGIGKKFDREHVQALAEFVRRLGELA